MTAALPAAGGSVFFKYMSLQPRNTVTVHPHNKSMVFTVDTNKLLTVPFFLSSLFPIPHHTTTQITCLKCKLHPSIVLLQNGSSRMVSHSYMGFQILHALPPASVVSVALPISSVLAGHLNGYTLSTLVFYLLSLGLEFSLPSCVLPALWSAW